MLWSVQVLGVSSGGEWGSSCREHDNRGTLGQKHSCVSCSTVMVLQLSWLSLLWKKCLVLCWLKKTQKILCQFQRDIKSHRERYSKVSHRFRSCSTLPGVDDTSCFVFFSKSSNGSFVSSDFEDSNTDSKPLAGLAGIKGGSLDSRDSACLGSTFEMAWPTCNVLVLEGPLKRAGCREPAGEGLCSSKELAGGTAGAWLNKFGMESVEMFGWGLCGG